jgi:hypothetical protein
MHHYFGQDLKDIPQLGFRLILFGNLHFVMVCMTLVDC